MTFDWEAVKWMGIAVVIGIDFSGKQKADADAQ